MNIIKKYHPAFLVLFVVGLGLVIVAIAGIISSFHHTTSLTTAKAALHKAPQTAATISISADGTTHIFGITLQSVSNGVLTASGTISGIPTIFTISTSAGTNFHVANATSSLADLAPGEVIQVTGQLVTLSPTISINATDVRALWIAGPGTSRAPILPTHVAPPASASTTSVKSTTTASATTAKKAPTK